MFTRRGIIIILFIVAAAVAFWKRGLIKHLFSRSREKAGPRMTTGDNKQTAPTRVGVAGGEAVEATIRGAVDLIGGFGQLQLEGKTVLVKPNVVAAKPPPTTSPQVVGAVVRILYEEGAKQVYVGDMSAAMHLNTIRNMEAIGIKQAAEKAGAKVIAFEDYDWVEVETPQVSFKRLFA